MQMFMVGGAVRDELLGLPSKDIDFSVVLDDEEVKQVTQMNGNLFLAMENRLRHQGFEIFLSTPEFLTVRARFPKDSEHSRPTADFVLARKESDYTDGRRPDKVEAGTLEDDLARRDFTMNAIAKAADGSLIDPFNGVSDIEHRLIRAVGSPAERLEEDALRAVRALRFAVTKGFRIEGELTKVLLFDGGVHDDLAHKIADERICDELSKMFRFDTLSSLAILKQFPDLTAALFSGKVSLDSTLKQRGRGK